MGWLPNDGVVPAFSAAFPGGTTRQILGDITHNQQTSHDGVRNAIYALLRVDFEIPER